MWQGAVCHKDYNQCFGFFFELIVYYHRHEDEKNFKTIEYGFWINYHFFDVDF